MHSGFSIFYHKCSLNNELIFSQLVASRQIVTFSFVLSMLCYVKRAKCYNTIRFSLANSVRMSCLVGFVHSIPIANPNSVKNQVYVDAKHKQRCLPCVKIKSNGIHREKHTENALNNNRMGWNSGNQRKLNERTRPLGQWNWAAFLWLINYERQILCTHMQTMS